MNKVVTIKEMIETIKDKIENHEKIYNLLLLYSSIA